MAQPGDYPPQAPGTISTCQINANCSSGNRLDQEKDAVGLLYYERHDLIPLLSYYKGTTAIVRKAGNNSGVIMTAGHKIQIENARKIVDTINRVIHGYDSVDDIIIWGIVINHLPKLRDEIEKLSDA